MISRNTVVLPAPLGPTSPTFSPGLIWNDASTNRICPPYCLLTELNAITPALYSILAPRSSQLLVEPADERGGGAAVADEPVDEPAVVKQATRDVGEGGGEAAHAEQVAAGMVGGEAAGHALVVVVAADAVAGAAQAGDQRGERRAGALGGDQAAPAGELAVIEEVGADAGVVVVDAELEEQHRAAAVDRLAVVQRQPGG